ncbi:hypothetical protein VP01_133g4 [Puccinia sorghi]|uniref:Uncharacterized protein n=1 Tax=Puccinia sorghi TaxID=27349 RepID=A0A0L6VP28_9BASI|nr:hypothetical protein VP01_133g4 [Puccinia sorghi]
MARLLCLLPLAFFLAVLLHHAPLTVSRPSSGLAHVHQESKTLQPRYSRYNGRATWFIPDTGACGDVNSKSDYIVAMNYAQYNNGSPCHKVVVIKNKANNRVVKAKVTDEVSAKGSFFFFSFFTTKKKCPSCAYGSLDLSPAAFQALGDLDTGVLPASRSHPLDLDSKKKKKTLMSLFSLL